MVLLRHNLMVDNAVQGTLLRRVALYGLSCALYFAVILFCSESLSDPNESFGESVLRCFDEMVYWLPGFAILGPVVTYDILRVTNRFTGPIFRMRREMQRLADGDSSERLSFREDDHWVEMADVFNQLRDELIELRAAKTKQADATPESATRQGTPARLFDHDVDQDADILSVGAKDLSDAT